MWYGEKRSRPTRHRLMEGYDLEVGGGVVSYRPADSKAESKHGRGGRCVDWSVRGGPVVPAFEPCWFVF